MSKKKRDEEVPEEIGRTLKTDGGAIRAIVLLKKVQNGRGHPMLVLTDDGVKFIERLYACNCTQAEVAAELGVSVDVLQNKANSELNRIARDRGRERFNSEIRQSQRAIMKRGDSRMAIWLGKQYLGQTDRIETASQARIEIKNDPLQGMTDEQLIALYEATK